MVSVTCFLTTYPGWTAIYPLYSDLFGGQRYPPLEQLSGTALIFETTAYIQQLYSTSRQFLYLFPSLPYQSIHFDKALLNRILGLSASIY